MKTSDFFYSLPEGLIAQTPIEPRDHARLLHLSRHDGTVSHHRFDQLGAFLQAGDLLVINDSRVLPARLYGQKILEGASALTGATIELLLLSQREHLTWETMVRPGRRAKCGAIIQFGDGLLVGEIVEELANGNRLVTFSLPDRAEGGSFFERLEQIGQMPLPPYITTKLNDPERYQTVYANEQGSAAAPTAGLHFTTQLMARLREQGVQIAPVTLHVGIGTFRPVKVAEITEHQMHQEHYAVPPQTAALIQQTKQAGGRVIAVGTTSCRTLESVVAQHGKMIPCEGYTDIFIHPGYAFQVIDGLITNFHLPESTLLMLVSAFAGHQAVMDAYRIAVEESYRFFSFGDAMLLL